MKFSSKAFVRGSGDRCACVSSSVGKRPRQKEDHEWERRCTTSDVRVCVKRTLLVESVFLMDEGSRSVEKNDELAANNRVDAGPVLL